MISGHFPSKHTAINEINILGPGEYLEIQSGTVKKKRFFQFAIEPDNQMDSREARICLDNVLKKSVIEHWNNAENPAILLSGGYDSQYIFYTIVDSVEDSRKLTTVTWGQDPGKRNADMDVARSLSKRFGTRHIEITKKTDGWREEYEKMFKAQNGMTASSFFHANELTVFKKLYNHHGIRSVIRGDECLGYGPRTYTVQSALIPNSMSFPEYVYGLDKWFDSGKSITNQYSTFMTKLVNKYQCRSYDCLKDIIDFYERQHMNRNPLNYYKLHYLDVFCPLIDPDVLSIVSKLPSKFRRHKKLFKQILEKKIGKELKIAKFTNLTDWKKVISESDEIKNFFIQELENLPTLFNFDFFYSLAFSLDNLKETNFNNKIKNILRPLKNIKPIETLCRVITDRRSHVDQYLHIPIHFLVMRAAVLSRWNKLWIKSN
jgi:asparagine synthetase B (glutamine-hydrolysing)